LYHKSYDFSRLRHQNPKAKWALFSSYL